MNLYKTVVWPVVKWTNSEQVHEQTLWALALAQATPPGRLLLQQLAGDLPTQPVTVAGLTFPNVLGMAAGFDKDVRVAAGLATLGFGHVEVGTLTPRPQAGNPRPRIFRLPADQALINRMGFPNGGVREAVPRLAALAQTPKKFILGVSLGKQKETPLDEAEQDYIQVMQAVYRYADYLAVNISSPNTPGLRELQGGNYLGHLLSRLQAENESLAGKWQLPPRPLFVKIAPDVTEVELNEMIEAVVNSGIAGVIATNTTLGRENLTDPHQKEAGGLSGRPVKEKSTAIIRQISALTAGKLPIIGVGGVFTAADVQEKLAAGASLVQVYTSLVYEGPGLPGRILRDLRK